MRLGYTIIFYIYIFLILKKSMLFSTVVVLFLNSDDLMKHKYILLLSHLCPVAEITVRWGKVKGINTTCNQAMRERERERQRDRDRGEEGKERGGREREREGKERERERESGEGGKERETERREGKKWGVEEDRKGGGRERAGGGGEEGGREREKLDLENFNLQG